jgi:cytochrome c oxidase accessory protein FixG
MYASRPKRYPREVSGRFDTARRVAIGVLLGLFYLAPWLRWDGRQAVLFDLPARKFYILGLVLWPQDFIFLTWLLVLAGLSLFFFTALAGRLWCGYACPQTAWTEAFVWIERRVEGDRARRMKLDRAPWSASKLARRVTKQLLWIALAAWTGLSFVGFFVPMQSLASAALTLSLTGAPLFWAAFYGFATYLNAGWMREQVCTYMCPYARFQGAMFDRDTLIISYDASRGEPRGARGRGVDPAARGLGDCIDCTLCVQACPTGIDIRAGLQYECIACAACIDACDSVMDRIGYARGLVRYATQNALEGGTTRVLRPRMLVYGALLLVLLGAGVTAIARRNPVGLDVIRDRNALYRETGRGTIENVYNLRILNKDERPHDFRLAVTGLAGARLDADHEDWHVGAGEVASLVVRVAVPAASTHGGHELRFEVVDEADAARRAAERARFIAP